MNSDIRVVTIDGQPKFVAADACAVLGFTRTDNMLRVLDAAEKQVTPRLVSGYLHHRTVLITESGLYKLIMRSDKPEAKAFQNWVTQVVLPAIRKDGMYVLGEEKVIAGEMSVDELEARLMEAAAIRRKNASGHTVVPMQHTSP